MKKLKEIEKILGESCWRSDNGQQLIVKACRLGDNFYDYGESAPRKLSYEYLPELKGLEDDFRIQIILCEDCSGCGGW